MTKNVRLLKGKVVVEGRFSSLEQEMLGKKMYRDRTTFEFWRTRLASLSFLEQLERIQALALINCQVGDASALARLGTLQRLFLNQVKPASGWGFLACLDQVEELFLLNTRGPLVLPDLGGLGSMRVFRVWGCKGFSDVSVLLRAPRLEEVELTDTALVPDDLLGLMEAPSVRYISARFGTRKENDLFAGYLQQYNKQRYRETRATDAG